MNKNFTGILADTTEALIDSVIENEIVKGIPILGTTINLYKGVLSIRDVTYLNKIKAFVEHIGEFSEEQRKKVIEESKEDEKRRTKFGDALITTLEQSDSIVKVEYLAIAFEAFLNEELLNEDFRLICHIIRQSFTDELVDVVENETPSIELKYVVPSGLADTQYKTISMGGTGSPQYVLSTAAESLREAWRKYRKV